MSKSKTILGLSVATIMSILTMFSSMCQSYPNISYDKESSSFVQ